MEASVATSTETLANRALPGLSVGDRCRPCAACHAGGRGFESRRSRLGNPAHAGFLCVHFLGVRMVGSRRAANRLLASTCAPRAGRRGRVVASAQKPYLRRRSSNAAFPPSSTSSTSSRTVSMSIEPAPRRPRQRFNRPRTRRLPQTGRRHHHATGPCRMNDATTMTTPTAQSSSSSGMPERADACTSAWPPLRLVGPIADVEGRGLCLSRDWRVIPARPYVLSLPARLTAS